MSNGTKGVVFLVGLAVVLLVVALRKEAPGPPATDEAAKSPASAAATGPAPKLVEVVDPHGRIALPLPVKGDIEWAEAGAKGKVLTASGGGVEVEAYDSTGPPVRALKLHELAVQNATKRGDVVTKGDRAEDPERGAVEVGLEVEAQDGRTGRVRYLLRGTRYIQVRALGPDEATAAVVGGLRLP